jgi:DNA-binding NarL/FixJ family response regulator
MAEIIEGVLLEDHPLFREGLKNYVGRMIPLLKFSYDGDDFNAAKAICAKRKPAIAIVDLHLGDGRTPAEIVGFFSSQRIPVLVISALNSFESVKSAFSVGASGFVSKDSSVEDIGRAIQNVIAGKEWVSPTLSKAIALQESISTQLSAQELKAVILYASGLKLDVVARRMDLASSTVKQYIDRAKAKFRSAGLNVSTKTELYKVLRDEGLIQ